MSKNTESEIDIGIAIIKKLNEYGRSIAWLARQVQYDRGNLYRQLHKPQIDTELLVKISIVLKTDFFNLYSQYVKCKIDVIFTSIIICSSEI